MTMKTFLQAACLGAILMAGSCAAPTNDGSETRVADPAVSHPIMVEPDYRAIKLSFSAAEAGLMPDDNARFEDFVDGYLAGGSGSMAISAPATADGDAAFRYFGERLVTLGVPRDRILVSRRQDSADTRVELNYVGYQAKVDKCGDWSVNANETASNLTMPNFGCSTQHNIAAMVADPRDLISPRPMDAADDRRRGTVFDKYEKGQVTSADKSNDQSGSISNVSK